MQNLTIGQCLPQASWRQIGEVRHALHQGRNHIFLFGIDLFDAILEKLLRHHMAEVMHEKSRPLPPVIHCPLKLRIEQEIKNKRHAFTIISSRRMMPDLIHCQPVLPENPHLVIQHQGRRLEPCQA